jgi:hypothetical protein
VRDLRRDGILTRFKIVPNPNKKGRSIVVHHKDEVDEILRGGKHPTQPATPAPTEGRPRVVLADGVFIVNGKTKLLDGARFDVVKALYDAPGGLTKDQLEAKSGRGAARRTLKRLGRDDSDWASVLVFPGQHSSGGYRLQGK